MTSMVITEASSRSQTVLVVTAFLLNSVFCFACIALVGGAIESPAFLT